VNATVSNTERSTFFTYLLTYLALASSAFELRRTRYSSQRRYLHRIKGDSVSHNFNILKYI